MKKLVSLTMLLVFAQIAGAEVNFDKGVDVRGVINGAKASGAAIPDAKYGIPTDMTRDCKKITFGAADPLTSPVTELFSRETYQDCQNMGYPVGQICTTSYRNNWANARISVTEPRVLQPGQKEVFEVCLWGSFLSMKPVSTVYAYSVNRVMDVFYITPKAPAQAADKSVSGARQAQDTCNLVMDSNYSCIYQCKDGSFLSKPNPYFGPMPAPGLEPLLHGCRPSVPNTPQLTVAE